MNTISHKQGFTLLYSVLVIGILLSIVFAILNISYKQVTLSGVARDSQIAFYMADTGAECAKFWDNRGAFATTTTSQINCNNTTITVGGPSGITTDPTTGNNTPGTVVNCPTNLSHQCAVSTFTLKYPIANNNTYKNEVVVNLYKDKISGESTLTAAGHNTDQVTSPRRLERAVKLVYTPRSKICPAIGNFMVVLDVSGSTDPYRTDIKNAADTLVNNLFSSPFDVRVGVITIGTKPYMNDKMHLTDKNNATAVADLKSEMDARIIGSPLDNGTNLQGAIRLANTELSGYENTNQSGNANTTGVQSPQRPLANTSNQVILITDGQAHAWIESDGTYNESLPSYCAGRNPSEPSNTAGCIDQQNQSAYEADKLKQATGASIYTIAVTKEPSLFCEGYTSCKDFLAKSIAGGSGHLSNLNLSANPVNLSQKPSDQTSASSEYIYETNDFKTGLPAAIEALTKCK